MTYCESRIQSYWFRPSGYIPYIPESAYIVVDDKITLNHTSLYVFVQCEPRIINDYLSYLQNHASRFQTIFTYDHDLLVACPHARFYIVARTWIPSEYYMNIDVSIKEYKISTLAGSKCINNSAGHLFRQQIHYRQREFSPFPIIFFRSSYQQPHLPDLGNNPFLIANTSTNHKESLFHTFQFAIIIENTDQRNCFSEKLIDCLITKTIPIYYGCVNIHQFFDTTGWIILSTTSVEDMYVSLHRLHPDYYRMFTEVIETNYQKAISYSDYYKNLSESISQETYLRTYDDKNK